jgi:DnaD/phage-associated family protein
MGLCPPETPVSELQRGLPEYSTDDVTKVMEGDPVFKTLVDYVRTALGKILTKNDLSRLLGIYDELGLPAGVIMLLVGYCAERSRRRAGEGARVVMGLIEREAYAWAREGITSEENAESYIRRVTAEDARVDELAVLLQIRGRQPTATEEKYLIKWASFGMSNDAVYLAYDKTIVNTGGLKWGYMDKILSDWQAKGIKTAAEAEKKGSRNTENSTNLSKQPDEPNSSMLKAAEMLRRKHGGVNGQ